MSMAWVLLAAVVEQSRAPVHLEGARKNGSSECWEQGAPKSRFTRPEAKNHLKRKGPIQATSVVTSTASDRCITQVLIVFVFCQEATAANTQPVQWQSGC